VRRKARGGASVAAAQIEHRAGVGARQECRQTGSVDGQ